MQCHILWAVSIIYIYIYIYIYICIYICIIWTPHFCCCRVAVGWVFFTNCAWRSSLVRQYLLWRILPPCWCQVASLPYCLMPGGILHLVSAMPKNLSLKSMKELLQIGRLQWPITNSSSTIEYIFISRIESNAGSSRIESSKAVEQDRICY